MVPLWTLTRVPTITLHYYTYPIVQTGITTARVNVCITVDPDPALLTCTVVPTLAVLTGTMDTRSPLTLINSLPAQGARPSLVADTGEGTGIRNGQTESVVTGSSQGSVTEVNLVLTELPGEGTWAGAGEIVEQVLASSAVQTFNLVQDTLVDLDLTLYTLETCRRGGKLPCG